MPDSAPTHAAGPVPGPPPTGRPADGGDPRVPEALAVLGGLADLPPAEHVARLEDVHRLLQDALASLDGT